MSNSLKFNAYHVLGLDISAVSKQILQRSNEVIQRLKIDDVPVYPLDVPPFQLVRTEDIVRDAVRRLQSPKLRMQELFFWFGCGDEVSKAALKFMTVHNYAEARRLWLSAAQNSGDRVWEHARQGALVSTLALLNQGNASALEASLQAWRAVLDSEEFWKSFATTYRFDGEFTANVDALASFRKESAALVSDIFTECQSVSGATNYVHAFQTVFAAKGARIKRDISDPAFQLIQKAIEHLNAIDLSEGTRFNDKIAKNIKAGVVDLQTAFNQLIDAGLFEDSETKVVRDKAAVSLRRIVLDLHNNQEELSKALRLLEIANRIAGTDTLQSTLAGELLQVQKNVTERDSNAMTLDIPGTFGGGKVVFGNNYIEYGNRRIFYKDAVSTSYQARSNSVNFIPISQSYSYMVSSSRDTIAITFGTTLYIDNTRKRDAFVRLASISSQFIEPKIVENLVRRIFFDGETVRIGDIDFDMKGYRRSKTFGGTDSVSWRDTVWVPKLQSGSVYVWKDKGGKGITFATVPMSTPNAVILPELVTSCVAKVQNHAA